MALILFLVFVAGLIIVPRYIRDPIGSTFIVEPHELYQRLAPLYSYPVVSFTAMLLFLAVAVSVDLLTPLDKKPLEVIARRYKFPVLVSLLCGAMAVILVVLGILAIVAFPSISSIPNRYYPLWFIYGYFFYLAPYYTYPIAAFIGAVLLFVTSMVINLQISIASNVHYPLTGIHSDFRHEVARVLNIMTTYQAAVIDPSRDGADIGLYDGQAFVGIVQCRQLAPDKTLPQSLVYELLAAKQKYRVDLAYIVTTARIKPDVKREAIKLGLKYIDGEHLRQLQRQALDQQKVEQVTVGK